MPSAWIKGDGWFFEENRSAVSFFLRKSCGFALFDTRGARISPIPGDPPLARSLQKRLWGEVNINVIIQL